MFVQSHIQRNYRQHHTTNSQSSSNKQIQTRSSSLFASSSSGSGKQRNKSCSELNNLAKSRRVTQSKTSHSFRINNSKSHNISSAQDKTRRKEHKSPLTRGFSIDELEEGLIVQPNYKTQLKRCKSRSLDSLGSSDQLFEPYLADQAHSMSEDQSSFEEPEQDKLLKRTPSAESKFKETNLNSKNFVRDRKINKRTNTCDCCATLSGTNNNPTVEYGPNQMFDNLNGQTTSTNVAAGKSVMTENAPEVTGNLQNNRQLKTQLSIIGSSRKKLELVTSFCINFITYQLETFRLLADSASITPTIADSSITQRPLCSICRLKSSIILKPKLRESSLMQQDFNLVPEHNLSRPTTPPSSMIETKATHTATMMFEPQFNSANPIVVDTARRINTAGISRVTPAISRLMTSSNDDFIAIDRSLETEDDFFLNRPPVVPGQYLPPHGSFNNYTNYLSQTRNQRHYTSHGCESAPTERSKQQHWVIRGGSLKNERQPAAHHLYRASTGIELRDNSEREQMRMNYRSSSTTNSRRAPPIGANVSFSSNPGSFELSLDEKYPLPPPVNCGWNVRNSYLQQQNLIERQLISKQVPVLQQATVKSHSEMRQNFNKTRAETITTTTTSRKQLIDTKTSNNKEKYLASNTTSQQHLSTGSDSELCSRKREQVSQRTATTRRPSASKPVSVEKINVLENAINVLEKTNLYLPVNTEQREDLRSISPASLDSNKLQVAGLNKLSKKISPSKLSLAGARRRLWLKQKGISSLSVQRSEEVAPIGARHLVRQMTTTSLTDSGTESGSCWLGKSQIICDPRACFVEGLGQGQIASRQALVSPYLGDIQISLSDQRGMLEVEVVRARKLHAKPCAKVLPSPFVKVYIMKNKKCIAKFKTATRHETLNPLYQEKFIFRYDYENCILQVIVWGDYGRKDRKSLMGITQIQLAELDISNLVIDWYQLFNAPSMASSLVSSKALRKTLLPKKESAT